MPRVLIDESLERTVTNGFAFPLGVYPVEPVEPAPGYVEQFEAADGAESFLSGQEFEDWEEWPDRFMFDVLISSERLPSLVRSLLSLLPLRVYPILDVLGHDAYREIDPYIAYDLVGLDRVIEGVRDFGPWFYEDGLVGFGAMSIDPFVYVFVDEHKIVTARVQLDLKETVEKLLRAHGLGVVEEVVGADAATHEHRGVLSVPEDRPRFLAPDEIIERLRSHWMLQLNIAGDSNVDDDGRELGITAWRCVVRCVADPEESPYYAEALLTADSLDRAEALAVEGVAPAAPSPEGWTEVDPVHCDRIRPERLGEALGEDPASRLGSVGVCRVSWPDGRPGEDAEGGDDGVDRPSASEPPGAGPGAPGPAS